MIECVQLYLRSGSIFATSRLSVRKHRVQAFTLPPPRRRVCRFGNFRLFEVGFKLPRKSLRFVTIIDPFPQTSQSRDIYIVEVGSDLYSCISNYCLRNLTKNMPPCQVLELL